MTWLPLNNATVLIAHDEEKARERLERAISKAWQTPFGRLPQPTQDPNIPLRVQVIPPAGQRVQGGQWLDQPVLDWETSEIECLCTIWAPLGVPQSPATQCRARIEVWEEDLVRLWGTSPSSFQQVVSGFERQRCEPLEKDDVVSPSPEGDVALGISIQGCVVSRVLGGGG